MRRAIHILNPGRLERLLIRISWWLDPRGLERCADLKHVNTEWSINGSHRWWWRLFDLTCVARQTTVHRLVVAPWPIAVACGMREAARYLVWGYPLGMRWLTPEERRVRDIKEDMFGEDLEL